MQVNPIIFRIIQVFILGLVLIIIGSVAYFLLQTDPSGAIKDTGYEAVTFRLQRSAISYHSKLREYSGVCSDIGVPTEYVCRESETQFIIYTRLSSGSAYCTDSSGFIGMSTMPSDRTMTCQ